MENAMSEETIENNRGVLATYPREKLIQLLIAVGVQPADKTLGDSTDDELRDLALSATCGY